jgi:hypothetical protein
MDITGIIGGGIGIIGLVYAFYRGRQYRKLRNFNRTQAWFIYSKARNIAALIQNTATRYRIQHMRGIDTVILEFLSKGEAYSQELIKETIRQIQLAEPLFDQSAFQRWISAGKIDEMDKALFVQMAIIDADSKERK